MTFNDLTRQALASTWSDTPSLSTTLGASRLFLAAPLRAPSAAWIRTPVPLKELDALKAKKFRLTRIDSLANYDRLACPAA